MTGFANTEIEKIADSVTVKGIEYPVMPFTDAHLLAIGGSFQRQGNYFDLGSFKQQSEAAEVIKEVVVPDLPANVISISKNGKYIWMLERLEIAMFVLQIVRLYFVRQLRLFRESGNTEKTAELEKKIGEYNAILAEQTLPKNE